MVHKSCVKLSWRNNWSSSTVSVLIKLTKNNVMYYFQDNDFYWEDILLKVKKCNKSLDQRGEEGL